MRLRYPRPAFTRTQLPALLICAHISRSTCTHLPAFRPPATLRLALYSLCTRVQFAFHTDVHHASMIAIRHVLSEIIFSPLPSPGPIPFSPSPPHHVSDVEPDGGGETALPMAVAIDAARQPIAHLSACANRQGISVVPEKVCETHVRSVLHRGCRKVLFVCLVFKSPAISRMRWRAAVTCLQTATAPLCRAPR